MSRYANAASECGIDGRYTYFAFICYTHADYEEAAKLHRKLQRYGLPNRLRKGHDKPKRLVPVFLDQEEMRPGNYEDVDRKALEESKFLIVVCSHNLHDHDENVNKEIKDFLSFGNSHEEIIPYIIDSDSDPVNNCFPSALVKTMTECNKNVIGSSIYTPSGRRDEKRARLKVIAKIHDLKASELENEDTKRKRIRICTGILLAITCALLFLGFYIYISLTQFPFEVTIKQRFDGTKKWYEEDMHAEVGDVVEFQVAFINSRGFLSKWLQQYASNNNLKIVSASSTFVCVTLPDSLEYLEDSTVLFNSNYQDGVSVVNNSLTKEGINIGFCYINANSYVRFKCRIIEPDQFPSSLKTWATVTIWPNEEPTNLENQIVVKDSIITTVIDNP